MNVKLTDDAVAGLPLSHGRAELLEEIMSTPVLDDRPARSEEPKRRAARWLVPVAAAAAIALVASVPLWRDDSPERTTAGVAAAPDADHVMLDAPGWTLTGMYTDDATGEMTYQKGDESFDVMWGPAESYDGYVEDRRHIVDPPADGTPVTVLGADAQMWPYSATDHTAIRVVEDGQWIELRGSGMSERDYLALLDDFRLVDEATFEASLSEFLDADEREAAVAEILDEIDAVADPLWPHGSRAVATSHQADPYQLGAEVAGAVACAWLDEYVAADQAGDQSRMDQAAAVLASSHDWPVLHRMNKAGDYPEVLWQLADEAAAGRLPEWYQGGLGC